MGKKECDGCTNQTGEGCSEEAKTNLREISKKLEDFFCIWKKTAED